MCITDCEYKIIHVIYPNRGPRPNFVALI